MAEKEYAQATAPKRRKSKKISRIVVEPTKNGGHAVEHHYESGPGLDYREPDKYAFGSGPETIHHLMDHMGVKEADLHGSNEEEPGGAAKNDKGEERVGSVKESEEEA